MHLSIRHETLYRYSQPQAYSIEQLHLTPRAEPQQQVLSWHIATPGHCAAYVDAYGNASHMLTLTAPHTAVRILVEGIVATAPLPGGRLQAHDSLPPLIFTVPTRLTQPTTALADVAAACLPARGTPVTTADLLRLAAHIHGAVAYQTGATHVDTAAAEAMLLGAGVCQDHAHVFLACCHAHGVPARYVSGYIDPGSSGHAASHAWVDAWAEDADFTGWVSIDVTHNRLMTDGYCRLAIGRDYESAAPVRGMRRGGGDEVMRVEAQIVPV
ncbi:transglutaminase family protein [Telluria mixta]|uniref:Transglutaminase family protein n=1 Tax=Telluria mixta TaxID=34071 RepID=A0ABT2C908_9BURK|nr:transglutaminase family protein [Telluria mixta]MCS0633896.1 transglutaminase family protein [Telluria mixta]WEM95512.1 transglutaminase family protein [Telluria mixta]